MKKLFLIFSLLLIGQHIFSQTLPRYMTEEEKLVTPKSVSIITEGYTTPPQFNVRTAAEWEEMQGLLITWDTNRQPILGQIVDYAQEECTVYIVTNISHSVITSYLTGAGIPLTNISFIDAPKNQFWIRDYGPISIYENYTENLSLVDWLYYSTRPYDDAVPNYVAAELGLDIYHTTNSPYNLRNYGGNFMGDGYSYGISTAYVRSNDPDEGNPNLSDTDIDDIMEEFNGVDPYIILGTLPLNAIDHIDMYMKLLDEENVLVGEYASGSTGSTNNTQIEQNINSILAYYTCYDRDFEIIRIPMPPITYDQYGYPVQRTYTNSLILNNTVLVPIYGLTTDNEALEIYRDAMPGYNVYGINCEAMIGDGGAIHCITMGIGSNDPIFISHASIKEVDDTGPYKIDAFLETQSGIQSASLYYSNTAGTGYSSLPLVSTGSNNYTAYLPPQTAGNNVYYYISATSNNNKTITKPFPAPAGYSNFEVPASATPPYDLALANETLRDGITVEFRAENSITAGTNYIVESGASLTLTAGSSVTLTSNFTVEQGAIFNANTDLENLSAEIIAAEDEYKLNQTTTAINDNDMTDSSLPTEYSLSNNYPNPFNPTTNIDYAIPANGRVTIKVYNILGQVVSELVNAYKSAGRYSVTFNASTLSSGVYFYRIEAGEFVQTKKLVLSK